MTREQKVTSTKDLLARGVTIKDVAAKFGVAVSTVYSWAPGGQRRAMKKRKSRFWQKPRKSRRKPQE